MVFWGERAEKGGQAVALGGDQSPSSKAPPKYKRKTKRCHERSGCQRGGRKGYSVRVIEEKKAKRDGPIKYFLPKGERSTFRVLEPPRKWKLKSLRMKRFLEEERIKGKKESVLLSVKRIVVA